MQTYIKIWCEFDIGQNDLIFPDISTARDWLGSSRINKQLLAWGVINPGETYLDLETQNLLEYDTIVLIEREDII